MPSFNVKKGLNIRLSGVPSLDLADASRAEIVAVHPADYHGIKPRLDVKEGDTVQRGSVLFHDKNRPEFKVRSPAAGRVEAIVIGARRALEKIVVRVSGDDAAELRRFRADELQGAKREELIAHLLDTGLLALIRQRPFGRMANPAAQPKAVFVNAMNTAPFQPDTRVTLKGQELAFQAGLAALGRLSPVVHLCIPERADNPPALVQAKGVQVHTFSGVHPAGNTSVHIFNISPLKPHDIIWTINADEVVLLGQALLEGRIPSTRIIAVGGPGVREAARKHYRIRIGARVSSVLAGNLEAGEQRVIAGDMLSGCKSGIDNDFRLLDRSITVLPEHRERHFLGWLMPGLNKFSVSRTFLSRWFKPNAEWALHTNKNGSDRAMVLTGLYEQYLPMNIMVDFLLRAVIAHDTEEAIKLGILETLPEDYALCSFVCPSKTDVMGIVHRGLEEIEKEGI